MDPNDTVYFLDKCGCLANFCTPIGTNRVNLPMSPRVLKLMIVEQT